MLLIATNTAMLIRCIATTMLRCQLPPMLRHASDCWYYADAMPWPRLIRQLPPAAITHALAGRHTGFRRHFDMIRLPFWLPPAAFSYAIASCWLLWATLAGWAADAAIAGFDGPPLSHCFLMLRTLYLWLFLARLRADLLAAVISRGWYAITPLCHAAIATPLYCQRRHFRYAAIISYAGIDDAASHCQLSPYDAYEAMLLRLIRPIILCAIIWCHCRRHYIMTLRHCHWCFFTPILLLLAIIYCITLTPLAALPHYADTLMATLRLCHYWLLRHCRYVTCWHYTCHCHWCAAIPWHCWLLILRFSILLLPLRWRYAAVITAPSIVTFWCMLLLSPV